MSARIKGGHHHHPAALVFSWDSQCKNECVRTNGSLCLFLFLVPFLELFSFSLFCSILMC